MSDWNLLNLGNAPLSFESARNVLLDPANAVKIFPEVPCINPVGGRAYLFQSRMALCKLHAKLDPYKFMYLGKGYNKEYGVMKRYYHLKHNRSDLNKQLYNFQRHIYCLAIGECSSDTMILYLVHYFGNDYLLQDAPYRKGVSSTNVGDHMTLPLNISYEESIIDPQMSYISDSEYPASFTEVKSESNEKSSEDFTPVGDDGEPSSPISHDFMSSKKEQNRSIPGNSLRIESKNSTQILAIGQSSRKRKLPNFKEHRREICLEEKKAPISAELNNAEYLFAVHMAAQLKQLPKNIKAKVKYQIATIFYEAEMKTLNGSEHE